MDDLGRPDRHHRAAALREGVLGQARRRWNGPEIRDGLGRDGAEWVLRGASALPGFPVDLAGRMSLGNMIPGTGCCCTDGSRDKSSEVLEALGRPAACCATPCAASSRRWRRATRSGRGDGAHRAVPRRARRKVDVDTADAVAKGFGFQPRGDRPRVARQPDGEVGGGADPRRGVGDRAAVGAGASSTASPTRSRRPASSGRGTSATDARIAINGCRSPGWRGTCAPPARIE